MNDGEIELQRRDRGEKRERETKDEKEGNGKGIRCVGKMWYRVENMGKSGLDFPLVLGIGVGDGLGWLGEEIEECRDSYSVVVR
jgi:hypothetical protein